MNFASFKKHYNCFAWILYSTACFYLCGCSTTSETFDCQAGQGVGCKSITEVNQLVDQQVRGQHNHGKNPGQDAQSTVVSKSSESFPTPIIATNQPVIENLRSPTTAFPLSDTFMVQRMPDEYLRVWIAPFQDHQGNLHEGSVIHTVLKPGYWKMTEAQDPIPDEQTP